MLAYGGVEVDVATGVDVDAEVAAGVLVAVAVGLAVVVGLAGAVGVLVAVEGAAGVGDCGPGCDDGTGAAAGLAAESWLGLASLEAGRPELLGWTEALRIPGTLIRA